MADSRENLYSPEDAYDSTPDSDDEHAMEATMDKLNISVSTQSLPPFSTLEKPENPVRTKSSSVSSKLNGVKTISPPQFGKNPASLAEISLKSKTSVYSSAVSITQINSSTGKRRHTSSSDDTTSIRQTQKSIRISHSISSEKPKQAVIFNLQNNANESEATQTTDGQDKVKYVVNTAAAPMWASARRHRLAESKANMRALHFSTLLEQDVIPGPFLGADKLPRYLLNEKGALSPAMSTLIRTQSIERTKLAIDELREIESSAARRAKYYNGITEQLYEQEGDSTYNEAANLQTSLVVHFKQIEAKRLQSLFNKELERKPADDVDLARLICRPQEELAGKSQAKATKRPRQPSTHREETTSKNSRPSNQASRHEAQAAPQAQLRQPYPPTNSRGG